MATTMRHVQAVVVLAIVQVSVFALLLFADADGVPYRVIPWDYRSLAVPWVSYGWDLIRSGFWPLWCPYAGGGVPYFINPGTGIYSPLMLLLGPFFGFSYRLGQFLTVVMMWVGGLGVYTLSNQIWRSRSGALLAGLCFELSSALFCHSEHLGVFSAYSLAPWLFWAILLTIDRGSIWGPPLITAIVYWFVTATYFGVILILIPWSILLVVGLLLRRPMGLLQRVRLFGMTAGAALLGAVMASVSWMPFIVSSSEYTRGKPLPIDVTLGTTQYILAAKDLWGILWSFTTSSPLPGFDVDMSMRGIYFGAVAVGLAVVCLVYARGWILAPLLTLTLASLLMSLGGWFFGRIFLHILFPVFNFSRLPAADSRGIAVLGFCVLAAGGAALIEKNDQQSLRLARKVFAALLFFYLASLFGLPWICGRPIEAQLSTVSFEIICMLLVLLALARLSGARLVLMLAGIAWLESGFCVNRNFEPVGQPISQAAYAAISRHVTQFPQEGWDVPRLGDGSNPTDQSSAEAFLVKKFHINDYNPLRLHRFQSLLDAGFLPWLTNGPRVVALPRGAKPSKYAEFAPLATTPPFKILKYLPNQVRYHVELSSDALLVFNEVYFPGWRATVDSQPTEVRPLVEGLRTVEAKAGNHEIVLTFSPRLYFVALAISLFGIATFVAWLVVLVRKRQALPEAVQESNDLFLGSRMVG